MCHSSFVQISIHCFALGLFSCFLLRAIVSCKQPRAISTLRFTATSYREWRKTSWGCVPRSTTTEQSFTAASRTSCYRCSLVFVFVYVYMRLFCLCCWKNPNGDSVASYSDVLCDRSNFCFCLSWATFDLVRVPCCGAFFVLECAVVFTPWAYLPARIFGDVHLDFFVVVPEQGQTLALGVRFFRRLCLQKHPASPQTSTALSVRPKNKHTTA